jgi:transcriptional regulator with XRE-family HTH domain
VSDSIRHELPERLRALRAERRWTQADLARELGTTPQTVSRWEQGSPPQAGLRRRLDALLGGDGGSWPPSGSRVLQFPVALASVPAVDVDDDQLRATAISAVSARVASGAPMSSGEIALMRSLLTAVGVDWADA